jgi:hypothetical protein
MFQHPLAHFPNTHPSLSPHHSRNFSGLFDPTQSHLIHGSVRQDSEDQDKGDGQELDEEIDVDGLFKICTK